MQFSNLLHLDDVGLLIAFKAIAGLSSTFGHTDLTDRAISILTRCPPVPVVDMEAIGNSLSLAKLQLAGFALT